MTERLKRKTDLLIKNGIIFDGKGSKPFRSNILISGDRISAISKDKDLAHGAKETIDASGLAVAPGFIDTHGHSEHTILADSRAEGKVYQGITTEINGNCGLSAAPLSGEALKQRKGDLIELGIKKRWSEFDGYFKILGDSLVINFATLVGHGNLRACVMGYENRKPNSSEMKKIKSFLKRSIYEGSIGLSTGLAYPPGVYSGTEELIELCKVLVQLKNLWNGRENIFTSHIRNEGDKLIESVEEIIRAGRETGARVHISHIKTNGRHNWPKIDKLITLIEETRQDGIYITCDRYPYIASSTDLDTLLPSWVYEGGIKEELNRLKNVNIREKIKREILNAYPERDFWDCVSIAMVSSEKNRWFVGKSISSIAFIEKSDPVDLLLRILVEEKLRVSAIFSTMSEDNLRRFLSLPYVMIGSDSAARCTDGTTKKGKPHPRGFGTFPRFLGRYVRQHGLMDLSSAIHKITMLPAETFGITGRGIVKRGAFADLVVFDHENIMDRATFEEPFLKSEGIHNVIVNGVLVLRDGKITGNYAGRILRNGV